MDGIEISGAATAGVYVLDSPSNTNGATVFANIQNSIITNSDTGILVEGSDATAAANFNDIYNNATAGVTNTSGNVMNAEYNWWGSNDGPEDLIGAVELPFDPEPAVADMLNAVPAGQLGNSVSEDVDYYPWTVTTPVIETLTFRSQAKQDGWVLESTKGSGKGGSKNNTAKVLRLGDTADNRQYRSILSFNTAALPDNATITSVVLKVKRQSGNITLKGLMVDIRKGAFGKAALQLGDFNAKGHQTLGSFSPAAVSNWYTINLTSAAGNINTTGLTQIRLRFRQIYSNNNTANILTLLSGNSVLTNRPQLIIDYQP